MDHNKSFRWLPLLGLATLALASFQAKAQILGVYRQLWTGLSTSDGSVNALTNAMLNANWPTNPNPAYTQVFTNFETESNLLDGYGQRLRGFVVPPVTGFYTFWISSGDNSSLFLSTDENPACFWGRTLVLANAMHIRNVPGRKTDVRDCEWLADLLRHGLLKASFIPPLEIRELRELVRYRQTVVTEHTAVANRITKLIESANLKLGQVASEVLGRSGRLMLRALAAGETNAEKLAELAQGKLKSKKSELRRALAGHLTPVQRWVLAELLTRVEELEAALTRVETRIGEEVAACAEPFVPQAVELLESIPGVGKRTAQTIVAEIGVDMSLGDCDDPDVVFCRSGKPLAVARIVVIAIEDGFAIVAALNHMQWLVSKEVAAKPPQ
jgi:hypothetical protein